MAKDNRDKDEEACNINDIKEEDVKAINVSANVFLNDFGTNMPLNIKGEATFSKDFIENKVLASSNMIMTLCNCNMTLTEHTDQDQVFKYVADLTVLP